MGSIDAVELAAGAVAGVDQAQFLQPVKVFVISLSPAALGRGLPVIGKAQPGQILS